MKILMISKAHMVGTYSAKLRELAKLGVELTVVVPPKWGAELLEGVKPDGYELLVTRSRFAGSALGRHVHHLHYYPCISDIVGREKWDLVHIDEEPFNFVTYHTLKASNRLGRKAIFFTAQNLMKRYPPPFGYFEQWVFKNVSAGIAVSEEALAVMRRRGFSKPACVIPHFGADPAVFLRRDGTALRRRLGIDASFVIGYMGRIIPLKGLDTLIRSLALLPSESVLLLVGSGPDRPRLQQLIDELGLGARVRWAPWVKSTEVPEYMNAFDALTLPSRTTPKGKEQFGRVLVEAMVSETCVVGSDSGEIPNVIGDGGLVFHEGDERGLADQLRRLMVDSSLRESIGRRGRERVLERFSYASIAAKTVSFYRRVCLESIDEDRA